MIVRTLYYCIILYTVSLSRPPCLSLRLYYCAYAATPPAQQSNEQPVLFSNRINIMIVDSYILSLHFQSIRK